MWVCLWGALGVGELGHFGGACVCGELGAFVVGSVVPGWVVSLVPSVTGYPRWVVSWMPSVRPRVSGVPGAMVALGHLWVCRCVGSGVPSGVRLGLGELVPFGGACVCGELEVPLSVGSVVPGWVVRLVAERDVISEVGVELDAEREASGVCCCLGLMVSVGPSVGVVVVVEVWGA